MSSERTINAAKTFRYEILNDSPHVRKVIFVLHGYGQLAKFFIQKFNQIPSDTLVVAPEGMHRFYLRESQGRVGASWMTKEARLMDIEDTINWLDKLYSEIESHYNFDQRILLGFSQGGATAARWHALGNSTFDALILWACVFPPDLEPLINKSRSSRNYFAIGQADDFFKEQKELIDYYKNSGFEVFQYNGKHDIEQKTLLQILEDVK